VDARDKRGHDDFERRLMPTAIIQDDRKVSLMRSSKVFLIILTALVLIPVIGVVVYGRYVDAQVARFYDEHPLLRSINELPHPPITRPPAELDQQRDAILLKRLPIGSSRADALEMLSSEGMKCSPMTIPNHREMLVCKASSHQSRWRIEIQFDENEKVSGGRVLELKAVVE
jgi:hypothetical protein